jgi:uncharacterized protein (DUF58 family)
MSAADRVVPGRRLAWALLAFAPLFAFGQLGVALGFACDAVVLCAAWIEARRLSRARPVVTRQLPDRFVLGEGNTVTFQLQNASDARLSGLLCDDFPAAFEATPSELRFALQPRAALTLGYRAGVRQRGQYRFGACSVRLDGALGLGSATVRYPVEADVRVYPNPRGPRRYELALRRGALHSVGVRSARRHRGGGEFEQLREYVPGDALRDFDWKAAAKRLRPITRVHGQEQSQNVLIALDAGRLMAVPHDTLTKLDHAIHAALLVAWVALRSGDRVGLIVFAEDVLRFLPAAPGHAQYLRLLDSLYAVQASASYVDFRELTRFVRARVPRRSLLLVFSDLLDESQALPLAAELPKLRSKHLPLCVTMSDRVAEQLATARVANLEQVYMRAAAADLIAERTLVKAQLGRAGVSVLEAHAADLAVETVNRYLEIKRQRML